MFSQQADAPSWPLCSGGECDLPDYHSFAHASPNLSRLRILLQQVLTVCANHVLIKFLRRHITKSLHGTNPYPGINGVKLLFKLINDTRKQSLNKVGSDTPLAECMRSYLEERKASTDPPTLESVRRDVEKYLSLSVSPTAEFVHRYLEKHQEKVFLVRNKADRERLREFLSRHL